MRSYFAYRPGVIAMPSEPLPVATEAGDIGVILPVLGLMVYCEIFPSFSLVTYALSPLGAIVIASGCNTVFAVDTGFGLSAPVPGLMRYCETVLVATVTT